MIYYLRDNGMVKTNSHIKEKHEVVNLMPSSNLPLSRALASRRLSGTAGTRNMLWSASEGMASVENKGRLNPKPSSNT